MLLGEPGAVMLLGSNAATLLGSRAAMLRASDGLELLAAADERTECVLPVSFAREAVAEVCRRHGVEVRALPAGVDGARLLWALAGNESSFGRNCTPRHEPAYDRGGRYGEMDGMRDLLSRFGRAAACSYGPWQLMLCNAPAGASPAMFADLDWAARATVAFLSELCGRSQPRTVAEVGQCWNAGHIAAAPASGVARYARRLVANYEAGLPAAGEVSAP